MFQTKFVEKIETHIVCSITIFFFENIAMYEIMWETDKAGQPTDGKMAHAY